jgi:hypothetical protein
MELSSALRASVNLFIIKLHRKFISFVAVGFIVDGTLFEVGKKIFVLYAI